MTTIADEIAALPPEPMPPKKPSNAVWERYYNGRIEYERARRAMAERLLRDLVTQCDLIPPLVTQREAVHNVLRYFAKREAET